MNQLDREEIQLENDLAQGLITPADFNRQMRELQREQQLAAREEREEAHARLDRDMGWD